jgi:hypothetical protein
VGLVALAHMLAVNIYIFYFCRALSERLVANWKVETQPGRKRNREEVILPLKSGKNTVSVLTLVI